MFSSYGIGAYFIDIDPCHFDRVMHYLRLGSEIDFSNLSQFDILTLNETLDYLKLPKPKMKWRDTGFGTNITYSSDFKKATVMCTNEVSIAGDTPLQDDVDIFICSNSAKPSPYHHSPNFYIGLAYPESIAQDRCIDATHMVGYKSYNPRHHTDITTGIILRISYDPANCRAILTNNDKLIHTISIPDRNASLYVVITTNISGLIAAFVDNDDSLSPKT